ncbi:GntR family transcriptional regulator [Sphingosinicella sp. CPCC 101087]|uniref:GntR family transcriptional regulator n=1 Tax=Sphingosinicella sp. CPCC 101087 TaxID=2497754 RepID=UPI0013EA5FE3|nr:GntR family transcriptional regulator [Sphingosinicella sp. CPCC 101087]
MAISVPAQDKGAAEPAGGTVQVVVDWLRERIKRRVFVPGQRLIEAEIIKQTGASRSRVREALRRLEADGLIEIEEFRGASVRRFSLDELRQIYRTRMALEGLAAAEFAASEDMESKQRLKALQDQLDALESTGNHELFARLNDEWHTLIIRGANNLYVEAFLARLRVPIYRLLFSTFYSAARIDAANADHKKITAAIVEGRVEDAERCMREHVAGGLSALADIDPDYYA